MASLNLKGRYITDRSNNEITKLPIPAAERTIDSTAGAFPTTTILTASLGNDGTNAAYQFTHIRQGQNNAGGLLMYALPHHVASFEASTTAQRVQRDVQLQTPSKGIATAVISNQWRMIESELPLKWATWLPSSGVGLSDATRRGLIDRVARRELGVDVFAGRSTDSMYFSGKVCWNTFPSHTRLTTKLHSGTSEIRPTCTCSLRCFEGSRSYKEVFRKTKGRYGSVFDKQAKVWISL